MCPPTAEQRTAGALVQAACRLLIVGDVEAARLEVLAIDEPAVRSWWAISQRTGERYRDAERRDISNPLGVRPSGEKPRLRRSIEREVFERDGYHCRYCGVPVVGRGVPKAMSALLGDVFMVDKEGEGADARSHAASLAFQGSADHVIPWSKGGDFYSPENVVTACGVCQYGKNECTIAALGLADPFSRPPTGPSWNGGADLAARARADARRRRRAVVPPDTPLLFPPGSIPTTISGDERHRPESW